MVRLILFAGLAFIVANLLINGFYLRRDVKGAEDPFVVDVESTEVEEKEEEPPA